MPKHLLNTKQTKKSTSSDKKRVFVGMSGGVDSSLAAALLQKAGYEVTGVFMKVWEPDFLPCIWRTERLDAMRVAAHLNIPLLTWDFEREYKEGVADYMIREYRAGRTPNPDVMCNREIKFGAFLKRALAAGADYVATGHYVQVAKGKDGTYRMSTSADATKDQSYFLWTLGQEALSKALFPIGKYKKTQVRVLAQKFNLPTAQKKDSQGLCFVGKLDMKDFLAHFIAEKTGVVLNEKGETIGAHRGAYFYTLGERHGFTVTQKGTDDSAYYVVAKDIPANTITISQRKGKDGSAVMRTEVQLNGVNYCAGDSAGVGRVYAAQVRYHGERYKCKIVSMHEGEVILSFLKPVLVDAGQSVVIYDGAVCVGGGIVV